MNDIMTVGKLKEILAECSDKTPIRMCMDWSEIDHPPKHLQQQWEDGLGEAFIQDKTLILLNRHFK